MVEDAIVSFAIIVFIEDFTFLFGPGFISLFATIITNPSVFRGAFRNTILNPIAFYLYQP